MKKWNKERFATIWENLESMIKLRSLRARIFLLILVIGLVPCIVMRHGIVSNYEDMAVEQRITVVQNQLMILANHLVSNNYLSSHGVREDTGNSREVINAELDVYKRQGDAEATAWGCDLSYDYVKINADYRS